jgi:hypothetical protein
MTDAARLKRLLVARELLHRVESAALHSMRQSLQQLTEERAALLDAEPSADASMIAIALGNSRRMSLKVADGVAAVEDQAARVIGEAAAAQLLARLAAVASALEARQRERSDMARLTELVAVRPADSAA